MIQNPNKDFKQRILLKHIQIAKYIKPSNSKVCSSIVYNDISLRRKIYLYIYPYDINEYYTKK